MANHIPQRMCVGCRNMIDKNKLIRIVVDNGELILDKDQKKLSRGLYVCKNIECIKLSEKKKVFQRAIKGNNLDKFLEELKSYAER